MRVEYVVENVFNVRERESGRKQTQRHENKKNDILFTRDKQTIFDGGFHNVCLEPKLRGEDGYQQQQQQQIRRVEFN